MARIVAQPPVEKKRILVADAFPMLRHGLVTFLNAQPDLIVCGEADSIPSALIKIAECKPHLLVIGLRLGAGDCVEFVKALKVQTPGLLILVYSGFEESIFAMRALRAGAKWLSDETGTQGRDAGRHLRYSTRGDLRQSRARHARIQRSARNAASNSASREERHALKICPTARCTSSTCSARGLAQKRSRTR